MAWNVFKKKGSSDDTAVVPATVSVPKAVPAKRAPTFSVAADALFLRPLVTEKALAAARHDVYAFRVQMDATKIDVKKAFVNLYGVMPTGVRMMRGEGKQVRFGGRTGTRASWKKALITVPRGTTIDIA